MKRKITPADLHNILRHNAEAGELFWLERPVDMFIAKSAGRQAAAAKTWNKRFAGKRALCSIKDGYMNGAIFGRLYRAHVVLWAMETGVWPAGEIDHENGIRSDNRLVNLRDVSHGVNLKNAKRSSNNKSGHTGVFPHKSGKWVAFISSGGKRYHLGYYENFEDAAAARMSAAAQHGFHANHGRHG